MKGWRAIRTWLYENWLHKRGFRRLQHLQFEEHREIITEVKKRKEASLRDLADMVMRLEAVTDRLEESISDLGEGNNQ